MTQRTRKEMNTPVMFSEKSVLDANKYFPFYILTAERPELSKTENANRSAKLAYRLLNLVGDHGSILKCTKFVDGKELEAYGIAPFVTADDPSIISEGVICIASELSIDEVYLIDPIHELLIVRSTEPGVKPAAYTITGDTENYLVFYWDTSFYFNGLYRVITEQFDADLAFYTLADGLLSRM